MNRPDLDKCPGCGMEGACKAASTCAKLHAARQQIAELADALGAFTAPFDGDSAEVIELETGPATAARVVAGRAILAKVRAV